MRTFSKLAVRALLAAAALGIFTSGATAGRLSFSEQTFRATWSELQFIGNLAIVGCPVTLEGSFHRRTLTKSAGTLIGYITRIRTNEAACGAGRVRMLEATLPWHITYDAFAGRLPTITAVYISTIAAKFLIRALEIFGADSGCLYNANAERPLRFELANEPGGITSFRPDETIALPLEINGRLPGGGCQLAIRVGRASDTATILGATTRIRVTLI